MKKLFTVLLMMFTLTTSFSQEKVETSVDSMVVTPQQISEAERIIDKYGSKAIDGLNNAVESITPLAKEGFEMAVKLQYAKGIGYLLPLVIFIILYTMFMKHYKLGNFTEYDWNRHATLSILLLFGCCISFGFALSETGDAILHLVAPEWFAFQDIIKMVK